MLRSRLCDYSDVYTLVKWSITVVGAGAVAAEIGADRNNKQATFKKSATFTECITEINNTEVDDGKGLDVVMLICNSIEYGDN